ncbi:TIM44-like domain-containing protein [Roseomonas frigidaquae]|uniref:TIM44-like domain-containing protein n=1 Tax=Falsiroseomonas frigidaquae TaxID=487318 RepID=A0ABX1F2H9_9PROT|nr:TIM44-like domain-containing protein [Falsiroseomonas frigidaquae]NKE46540.1 TIM44-like domain-containing protein [Falsiroseomonas frigidaquae]
MRRKASFMAAIAVVALALAPALAEARRGGGFSSGSRGTRTYQAPPSTSTSPGGATQFQRTQTGPAAATTGAATAGTAAAGATAARGGMRSGLMGGLLGAGLIGMFLGAGLFGGLGGFASILGLLLQVALIGGVIWLVMRMFRSRREATAGGPPNVHARDMQGDANPRPMMGGRAAAAGPMPAPAAPEVATAPLQIVESDYQEFEQNLQAVNDAWSRQDLEALRRLSTSEMTNYFAQDLKDLRARGWTNTTSGTKLEAGDLSEAWQENGQHYATVAMRYSIVDVTTDASGKVVEGHPTEPQVVTEILTYTRFPGESWRLSAIQQTG